MEGRKLMRRVVALAALTVAAAFIMIIRLYDLQIVNGLVWSEESERRITRTVEVPATRGEIVDRYGRKLVTNRIAYNIGFDTKLLPSGRENEVAAGLVAAAESEGVEWETNFPLVWSRVMNRWMYSNESTVGASRMGRFLAALEIISADEREGWQEKLDPDELAAKLYEEYELDADTDPQTARGILAVRWELDIRSARIALNIPSYVFASDVNERFISVVAERDLPGVEILTETVPQYETDSAANLLGRVTSIYENEVEEYREKGYPLDATVGRDGVEKAFEDILRGKDGVRVEERSESGSVTGVVYSTEPEPGSNVMLTIDISLQETAEKSLAARIEEIKSLGEAGLSGGAADVAGGAAVVIDVKNFEILAAANYPTYSLKTFNEDYSDLLADPLGPMNNRAFMGLYQPGSTFKPSTAVAALESGVITPSTRIMTKGIYTYYQGYQPACEIYLNYRGSHGLINVVDAIRVSCNYFFYEVGRLSGIDRMNTYAKMLGLGEATGVELPEYTGILAGKEEREASGGTWYGGDTLAAAIGQSDNLFTPLQMAVYVASLVNPNGERLEAHLLKSVRTYDYSSTISEYQPKVLSTVDISDETRETVKKGMLQVSRSGSAVATFGNYPIDVGSKTGTAQTGSGSPTGVFVAFAPYDDPQIAVAVVVEHAGKGSIIGSVARDIFDAYFRTDSSFDAVHDEGALID